MVLEGGLRAILLLLVVVLMLLMLLLLTGGNLLTDPTKVQVPPYMCRWRWLSVDKRRRRKCRRVSAEGRSRILDFIQILLPQMFHCECLLTSVVDGWKADRGGGVPVGLGREHRHGRVDEDRRTAAAMLITVTA